MNGNAPVRSGVRGWPAAAVAVALVAGVAVASSGSIPSGSGAARRPSETLLDTVVSLAVAGTALGMVVAVAVFVLLRREVAATEAPARRNGRATAIALLWFGGLLLGVALLLRSDGSGSDRGGVFGALGRRRTDTPPGAATSRSFSRGRCSSGSWQRPAASRSGPPTARAGAPWAATMTSARRSFSRRCWTRRSTTFATSPIRAVR